MDKAKGEIGVTEKNPGSNPRIETYLKSAGLNNASDATAWCGAFVNWSLLPIKDAGALGSNYSSGDSHWINQHMVLLHYLKLVM